MKMIEIRDHLHLKTLGLTAESLYRKPYLTGSDRDEWNWPFHYGGFPFYLACGALSGNVLCHRRIILANSTASKSFCKATGATSRRG
ncbi:MAG TPA: hypothetical protein VGG97_22635 [Bryobacteraceae bacterium]|jgi:hypothetical protein